MGPGIVDKVVEPATSDLPDFIPQRQNGILFVNVKSKSCDIPMRLAKLLQVGLGSRSSDDFETPAGKLESESSTDSTAATSDEYRFHSVAT